MIFPKRIAVTVDENNRGSDADNLLAWRNLVSADDGKVGIYELVEEVEKKTVPKVRRKGTKTWLETSEMK